MRFISDTFDVTVSTAEVYSNDNDIMKNMVIPVIPARMLFNMGIGLFRQDLYGRGLPLSGISQLFVQAFKEGQSKPITIGTP